ncbi:MAG: flagellar hook-length control protein FliK [Thermodesulfobacteriota bacterium]|nr:flagellar hook-length control protein FliK [Thermodesulfobacteriota bacterium]
MEISLLLSPILQHIFQDEIHETYETSPEDFQAFLETILHDFNNPSEEELTQNATLYESGEAADNIFHSIFSKDQQIIEEMDNGVTEESLPKELLTLTEKTSTQPLTSEKLHENQTAIQNETEIPLLKEGGNTQGEYIHTQNNQIAESIKKLMVSEEKQTEPEILPKELLTLIEKTSTQPLTSEKLHENQTAIQNEISPVMVKENVEMHPIFTLPLHNSLKKEKWHVIDESRKGLSLITPGENAHHTNLMNKILSDNEGLALYTLTEKEYTESMKDVFTNIDNFNNTVFNKTEETLKLVNYEPATGKVLDSPSPQNTLRIPYLQPLENNIISQIIGKIHLDSREGVQRLNLQLQPETLGRLHLEITIKDNHVVANIFTENPLVKDIIEANLHVLRSSLYDQGFKINECHVFISGNPKHGHPEGKSFFKDDGRKKNEQIDNVQEGEFASSSKNHSHERIVDLVI